jgi:hypothetical protein
LSFPNPFEAKIRSVKVLLKYHIIVIDDFGIFVNNLLSGKRPEIRKNETLTNNAI